MPSTITHTYFAKEVYQTLPSKYQDKIKNKEEYYKLFAQGPDPFMFYHFYIGKNNKGKILQKKMHTEKTKNYFISVITYIHKNNLSNNPEIMAYLYGYICHYYLDLYAHPFINYQAGLFNKNNQSTYKNNNKHAKIEYRIDSYIIKNILKKDPKKIKVHQYIFKLPTLTKNLKQMIKTTLHDVYSIKNGDILLKKSILSMKLFYRYFNYDPKGYKRKIYTKIDRITPKTFPKLKDLSYHTNNDGTKYLNLEHENWHYPWYNSLKKETSFFDLFEQAKQKSSLTIIEVTNLLEEKKLNQKKLNQLFQNLSYVTGLPCDKKIINKYFKENNHDCKKNTQ